MVPHYRIFNYCSYIELVPLQDSIEHNCFLLSHCAQMLCWDQNRGQEIEPYLSLLSEGSPVQGFWSSFPLSQLYFSVSELFGNLLEIWVFQELFELGPMLVPCHSIGFVNGPGSIWYPHSSDEYNVVFPAYEIRLKVFHHCCVA